LSMGTCALRQLNSSVFDGLVNLAIITLSYNELEELPPGLFVPLQNIYYIGLEGNRLKTVRRNVFGSLTSLQTLNLDSNIVNALDRGLIDEAVNLQTIFFQRNLCASSFFGSFEDSRPQHLQVLETCFSNMRYIIDTTTEGSEEFSFFEGPHPGIALRVNTDNEVHISLTSFDVIWNPVIEILIGTSNNTRTVIRQNQEIDVVTVPTPNILSRDQRNDFRITWDNNVVLVYRGNERFPFMTYTMQYRVPVNFYGLRAVGTTATWSVQPFDW